MPKIPAVLLCLLLVAPFLAAQQPQACQDCKNFQVPRPCQLPRPRTPSEVLDVLQAGNNRFTGVHGKPLHPGQSRACVTELLCCQKPFAIVLSCADSRVPPEVVFDQGVGDLFVVRVAGNVAGYVDGKVATPAVFGSIEYAVDHFTDVIIVLGHQRCGAVAAAFGDQPGPHLNIIWDLIRPAIPANSKIGAEPDPVAWERAIRTNVDNVVKNLRTHLQVKGGTERLTILGAYFSLDGGAVQLPRIPK
jgi:carbonic anhydrase